MIETTMGATRALLLATTAIVSVSLSPAYAETFTGNDVTTGPFSSGVQYFYNFSTFDANSQNAASGGTQNFYDTSELNASASNAVSGGVQLFSNFSILNASIANAVSGGNQVFSNSSALNATTANAVNGGNQAFRSSSTLNAKIGDAVSDGIQTFYNTSALNASASNAVSDGEQTFYNSSALNATAEKAVSGGTQVFRNDSALNASAGNAVSGGDQYFLQSSTLNASVGNAVSGGKQIFYNSSALNASAADAVSGGIQTFSDTSALNATAGNAVSGGSQSFYDTSALTASTADAISGGAQTFYYSSTLDASVGGAVSGGIQTFYDTGTLNVLADNALTSGIDIRFNSAFGGTGGTLLLNGYSTIIGRFSSARAGSGVIANGGVSDSVLTVDMSGFAPATFSGTIIDGGVGTLALNMSGGKLTLAGTASHTGGTTVSGGTLLVGDSGGNGSLGGSVDVTNGGTLGGSGTVGSGIGSLVTVASGGTLSPGNSIGKLTIDGDIVFAAGSIFAVEVNPEGPESDLLVVTGNATLNGGSVVHIGATGAYDLQSTYTILSAGSSLVGAFGDVSSNFAFLTPKLLYDYVAFTVDLELARNDRDFAAAALTRNQIGAARGIESIGFTAGHPVYDAIAQLPADDDLIRASFDGLSGEIHGSAKTALIEDSRFIRNAINDRIRAAFSGAGASSTPVLAYNAAEIPVLVAPDHSGPVLWSQGFGSWGSTDSDGNAAPLDRNTGGLLIGADTLVGDWRVGLLAGYSHSRFDVADRFSSGSSDNYHLGLYGGTEWGNFALRTGAAYAWHEIETSRSVAIPGLTDALSSNYSAGTVQAFGELAYGFDLETGSRLEPFANLAHASLHTNDFTEQGGAAALTGTSGSTDVTFTTLGLRAGHNLAPSRVDANLNGMVGWRHASGDTTPQSTHAFSAGDAFTIAGAPIAKDSAVIEAGLDLNLTPNATFGLVYTGQLARKARDHGFRANFRMLF